MFHYRGFRPLRWPPLKALLIEHTAQKFRTKIRRRSDQTRSASGGRCKENSAVGIHEGRITGRLFVHLLLPARREVDLDVAKTIQVIRQPQVDSQTKPKDDDQITTSTIPKKKISNRKTKQKMRKLRRRTFNGVICNCPFARWLPRAFTSVFYGVEQLLNYRRRRRRLRASALARNPGSNLILHSNPRKSLFTGGAHLCGVSAFISSAWGGQCHNSG